MTRYVKPGCVIICGDFNTDIIKKRSSLKFKLLVDCVSVQTLFNTFESDETFSYQSTTFLYRNGWTQKLCTKKFTSNSNMKCGKFRLSESLRLLQENTY